MTIYSSGPARPCSTEAAVYFPLLLNHVGPHFCESTYPFLIVHGLRFKRPGTFHIRVSVPDISLFPLGR